MPVASPGAPPGRVFYGWTVVTAAGLVLFMAYGTQYAFGVFFAALVEEFGWSRASVSGVFSLYAAVYSGFALMAGRLTCRATPPWPSGSRGGLGSRWGWPARAAASGRSRYPRWPTSW